MVSLNVASEPRGTRHRLFQSFNCFSMEAITFPALTPDLNQIEKQNPPEFASEFETSRFPTDLHPPGAVVLHQAWEKSPSERCGSGVGSVWRPRRRERGGGREGEGSNWIQRSKEG